MQAKEDIIKPSTLDCGLREETILNNKELDKKIPLKREFKNLSLFCKLLDAY